MCEARSKRLQVESEELKIKHVCRCDGGGSAFRFSGFSLSVKLLRLECLKHVALSVSFCEVDDLVNLRIKGEVEELCE